MVAELGEPPTTVVAVVQVDLEQQQVLLWLQRHLQ
jgi:hypothetical protein